MKAVKAALEDYAIGHGLGGEVEIGMSPAGIVIRLNDTLLFTSGRAHLDDHAIQIVQKVAEVIKPLPNSIRIEGNTDDQAPDGVLFTSNWDLSTAQGLGRRGRGPEPSIRAGQRPVQPTHSQYGRGRAGQEPPRRHRDPLPGGRLHAGQPDSRTFVPIMSKPLESRS
jgi:chemotaxis protein MotB